MPVGVSIHIAVNHSPGAHFRGRPELAGCLADARGMHDLAVAAGFEARLFAGTDATGGSILEAIAAAGERVGGDGVLLLTFAGHGSRARAPSGPLHRWCLHDRELGSAELHHAWAGHAPGARVLVVSDCCFSGDTLCGARGGRSLASGEGSGPASGDAAGPRVLLLSAARDNEGAADGTPHGAFTQALLDVWDGGRFDGDYVELHARIYRRLIPRQHPVLRARPSPGFARQRAFSI